MKFIKLRPATLDDAKILFQWKNEAEVRKYAIKTHNKIDWDNHLNWLLRHVDEIKIITDGITDYGDIRIEGNEIAIKIDKKYRHKGIGTQVLRKFAEKYVAKIVEGNIASMRLFISAGFKPVKYKKGYYIFER